MIVLTLLPGVRYGEKKLEGSFTVVLYSQFLGENTTHRAEPHREVPGLVMRQRETGTVGKCLCCGFCGKEWPRQGKQA